MAQRFCAGCGTDVEDVGGYCLLGHNLRLVPGALQDIQADIATAFEAASGRMEAAFRLAGLPQDPKPPQFVIDGPPQAAPVVAEAPSPQASPVVAEAPSPQAAPVVAEAPSPVAPSPVAPAPVASPSQVVFPEAVPPPAPPAPIAPSTPGDALWGPPPPPDAPSPSAENAAGRWEHLWGSASPEDVLRDPITAFSPPPSMDWGPQKDGKRKLRSRRPGQKSA